MGVAAASLRQPLYLRWLSRNLHLVWVFAFLFEVLFVVVPMSVDGLSKSWPHWNDPVKLCMPAASQVWWYVGEVVLSLFLIVACFLVATCPCLTGGRPAAVDQRIRQRVLWYLLNFMVTAGAMPVLLICAQLKSGDKGFQVMLHIVFPWTVVLQGISGPMIAVTYGLQQRAFFAELRKRTRKHYERVTGKNRREPGSHLGSGTQTGVTTTTNSSSGEIASFPVAFDARESVYEVDMLQRAALVEAETNISVLERGPQDGRLWAEFFGMEVQEAEAASMLLNAMGPKVPDAPGLSRPGQPSAALNWQCPVAPSS
mmetsp:Transcript_47790/g.108402  ORF Transcript_47790/g.108402 Transcript_47790/m.108402 type:complete len:313 (+) Transcript_47790:1-939(+)